MLFEVDFVVTFKCPDEISDQVEIDFNEPNFFVKCPYVELEIVKPLRPY